ncbi:hypothetical protein [Maribacter sp. 2307ULW6-5]|uniref:hypothetical protein n=1 Tax=Maribacter sp. 2307ULW6-5 TaxID=3386275 RepID=UPI0039BC8F9A
MKKVINIALPLLSALVLMACVGEVKEKLKTAKEGVSNASTLVKEAQKASSRVEKLREAVPLTNEQLKAWLPENLDGMERTGFKVGQAGMYKVNSVEGTYKASEEKKKFNVMVIDGAGPTGSMMSASYGLLGNFEMESEDEYEHQQTVEVGGIKAQQTYKKKLNDTQLLFAYRERFLVTVNATDINVAETWELTEKLNLGALAELAE